LAKTGSRATFFVLGWVADRHPDLLREIQSAGHDVGSHSYWHRLIYNLSPEEFRTDLKRSIESIRQVTGEPVTAFRAASFSITAKSLWALEILVEEGIEQDSSIFPVHHDRYGIPHSERFPYTIETAAGPLTEFPPSVAPIGRWNLPVGGGGYFRLYPTELSLRLLARVNRVEAQPFMFYVHPWEVDPDQPRLPGSLKSRFRHYQNLRSTHRKLGRLLERFQCGSMRAALASCTKARRAVRPQELLHPLGAGPVGG
jgi:polysaccharide deacetylase family protein (PEP-CTERM system associated)